MSTNKLVLSLLLLPILMQADSLKTLLDYASKNNSIIIANNFNKNAKSNNLKAANVANYPVISVGGNYQNLHEKSTGMPGSIYSANAKVSYNIYDGGVSSLNKSIKKNELLLINQQNDYFLKSIKLQIVNNFYLIKNIESSILSLEEQKHSIDAQLQRIQKFYEAQLATKDDIDKLKSAYDTIIYNIESLKFQKIQAVKSLELTVSKKITTLNNHEFKKVDNLQLAQDDTIKSLETQKHILDNTAESIDSIYKPKLSISNTYSVYAYDDTDITHPEGIDKQNKLLLNLNIRLYDGGNNTYNKKAILENKKALSSQKEYKINEQEMNFSLSKIRIKTAKLNIVTSKSALTSAVSAYETISKKYKAGIVDNIAFLDALSVKTNAKSLYKKSLNDLEVAYATYYYYGNKNIGEYIK